MAIWMACSRTLLLDRSEQKCRRQHPYCDTKVELDMVTLVWTRGENSRSSC